MLLATELNSETESKASGGQQNVSVGNEHCHRKPTVFISQMTSFSSSSLSPSFDAQITSVIIFS